jgi:hypothetical protein
MKPGTSTWTLVRVVGTHDSEESVNATWRSSYTASSRGTYQFQVRFAGTDTLAPSVSRVISVTVR